MKILVTGVSGQLGFDVCRELDRRGIDNLGLASRDMDITDPEAVSRVIKQYMPDAVIHCAAYTRVDKAQEEPERCWAVNAQGTFNIASVCRELNIKMLYISTDYVFAGEGENFYRPEDAVDPRNVYGMTKLSGELAVRAMVEKFFIVRISWVFGINGGNFIKTMLRLSETKEEVSVVCDQIGSPTYTADLAPLLCDMIVSEKYGLYHATNEGICSWAELAQETFRLAGKSTRVRPIPSSEYPVPAPRPLNSRLDKSALAEAGFGCLPTWESAVSRYIESLLAAEEQKG